MQQTDIYIDTSLKGPKRRRGCWMYILAVETKAGVADTGKMQVLEDTTEHQATLYAMEAALKRLNRPCHICLHLECPYVASALQNQWYEKWRQQDWRNARNERVKDWEIWCSIQSLLNAHSFEVRLKEHHTYREWMQRTLKEREEKEHV